jgi:hypothetical protein
MFMICDHATSAEPETLVKDVIAAAGGKDKLLKLFRMEERYNWGSERKSPGKPRTSVVEPPKYWWKGTKERGKEPAKTPTWAWTLGALTDAKSQIAIIPDVTENKTPLDGLRITGTIEPPLDMYFDKKTRRLVRIDWRKDIYVFSEWRTYDGTVYSSKCIIYKRKTRTPWFHHEIIKLDRLTELPKNLKR